MDSPIPRNVPRACTKVSHYPYQFQVPYDKNIRKYETTNVFFLIGVRGYPYGICCPWVRWGWGLDGLGKLFRRRRRRRRRRPPWTNFPPIS